ncbi:MAG TPA: transglycosylase domain-containing protein [Candidatus Paceibacterota bacterium]|nr:transglycosylase domain-containing protein [Candidatus Paceibacterota bacterium]
MNEWVLALCAAVSAAAVVALLPYTVGKALAAAVRFRDAFVAAVRWSFTGIRRTCVTVASLTAVLSALALNIFLFGSRADLPDIGSIINFRPPQIGYFYDGKGIVAMRMATSYREPVPFERVPDVVRQAIIAAEDRRFYDHYGVDFRAWPRVIWRNATGQSRQGGSTVTQQLERNMFQEEALRAERGDELVTDNVLTRLLARHKGIPWTNRHVRKVFEVRYALHLERGLTEHFLQDEAADGWWDYLTDGPRRRARKRAKDHIFACYANLVYLGHGVYGVSYASRFYFGKPLEELQAHEAALLASFIPYPGPYASLDRSAENMVYKKLRRDEVLRRMANNGYLTEDERWYQSIQPLVLPSPEGGGKTPAPAAINMALNEVKGLGIPHDLIVNGFAHPHMTVDLAVQSAVNRAAEAGRENFAKRWPKHEVPQMAVVVLRNSDAAVLGIYGGHYDDTVNNYSLYNRALTALRQPGSTFKAVDALAFAAEGVGPDDLLLDAPFPVSRGRGRGTHWISNYDNEFRGLMPLREVIAQSRNAPTIRMARQIGIPKVVAAARLLGITSPMDAYPTTALGSNSLTPLELTNAYRAIASGVSATPYIVTRVTDETGAVLVEHTPETAALPVSPEALFRTRVLLRGTVRLPRGTSRSLDSSSFGIPLACKTGTTNDHRDAWHICFNDDITVGTWVGYDSNIPLPSNEPGGSATGATAALPVNREVFLGVYGENSPLGFPPRFPRAVEQDIDDYLIAAYPERYGVK